GRPPPAATPAPSSTGVPLPPRPYQVAIVTLSLVDTSRPTVSRGQVVAATRTLATVVWYPLIPVRAPLLLFAPGFMVGPDTYRHLAETWAAAGYVVAAPEFPLTDAAVAGAALDENDLENEPADVRFVRASLLSPSNPVAERIDPTRIGVAGHSDGAEVALAVAQQGDGAVRAVMAFSAQPVTPHMAANPPLLVAQGSADDINPPDRAQAVYNQAANPRYLLTLVGAGHLPPFAGGSRWQPVVDQVSVDFLDRYLSGRSGSTVSLIADSHRPGLAGLQAQP
ncbi:MAG: hypothetical protein M3N98_01230, partial [Actinomycetota bacterium]|nr:hypothetical protein [Actinomycetota bacterium]